MSQSDAWIRSQVLKWSQSCFLIRVLERVLVNGLECGFSRRFHRGFRRRDGTDLRAVVAEHLHLIRSSSVIWLQQQIVRAHGERVHGERLSFQMGAIRKVEAVVSSAPVFGLMLNEAETRLLYEVHSSVEIALAIRERECHVLTGPGKLPDIDLIRRDIARHSVTAEDCALVDECLIPPIDRVPILRGPDRLIRLEKIRGHKIVRGFISRRRARLCARYWGAEHFRGHKFIFPVPVGIATVIVPGCMHRAGASRRHLVSVARESLLTVIIDIAVSLAVTQSHGWVPSQVLKGS